MLGYSAKPMRRVHQADDGVHHLGVGFDQPSVCPMGHEIRNSSPSQGEHWQSGAACFQGGNAEGLQLGRCYEQVRAGVDRTNLAPAEMAAKSNPIGHGVPTQVAFERCPLGTVADDVDAQSAPGRQPAVRGPQSPGQMHGAFTGGQSHHRGQPHLTWLSGDGIYLPEFTVDAVGQDGDVGAAGQGAA